MQVVKGRYQARVFRQQHTVTENVTRHITNTHTCEIRGLTVDSDLSEVTLNRLPGTTCRDPHFLMVVTDAATRCKRIAQPEVVFF